jgi:hypothetical protein
LQKLPGLRDVIGKAEARNQGKSMWRVKRVPMNIREDQNFASWSTINNAQLSNQNNDQAYHHISEHHK